MMPYNKIMKKVEARTWLINKEIFDQYALDKLALLRRVNLAIPNKITLLADGINNFSLKNTAQAIPPVSIEAFLDIMRRIDPSRIEKDRKFGVSNNGTRNKGAEEAGRSLNKRSADAKTGKREFTCYKCNEKGHRAYECPLKAKERKSGTGGASSSSAAAASVTSSDQPEERPEETVTSVNMQGSNNRLTVCKPCVEICRLNGKEVKLSAMLDTGSPVLYVKNSVYRKFIKSSGSTLTQPYRNLKSLSDETLSIIGIASVNIALQPIANSNFDIDLHVLDNGSFKGDIIIGCDFFEKEKLVLVYEPAVEECETVNIFRCLPLSVSEEPVTNKLEIILDEHVIDYGGEIKARLKELISDIEKRDILPIDDGYTVQVHLKDDSIFAYAPRRFAHMERLQIRQITDDLLRRGIIQPSISPYCARVVPVRKKNGHIRLCVDLRPLNSRVVKQKYPFPVIEECLARLSNKKVFSLLDLKDSFHQIAVHKDSTKYVPWT